MEPELSGRIRISPEDFYVREIPSYPFSGSGEYLILKIRRKELNTKDVQSMLAKLFNSDESAIGYAGLKDRNAVCEQNFSIRGWAKKSDGEIQSILQRTDELELLDIHRHQNGLRRGHLSGNHFSIAVRSIQGPGDLRSELNAALQRLQSKGIVNLYGQQRFGNEGSTLAQGFQYLEGKKGRKWMLDLGMNAVQSYVFNHYLRIRNEQGSLFALIDGDLAVTPNGGIFKVPQASAEQERMQNLEISYTGPIFGKKMRKPEEPSLTLENRALEFAGLSADDFGRMKMEGARRAGIVFPANITMAWESEDSVRLDFSLPSGSYATVALGHLFNINHDGTDIQTL